MAALPGLGVPATPGPGARYRAGGVTDGTYIYVFGGGDSIGGFYNDLWRWDPATQTWTQLANMPTGKQNIQGAYWNGKIYVPGGFNASGHITENAIYDIATNSWATGAPLPATQTGTNVAFNNKIYNFGGNPGPQSITRIYDIATNTWSPGASMPVATTYGRATVAGNYAYYVGGIAGVTTNAVYRYDFAANSWATMAPLQTARTSEELMTSPDSSKLFAVMGGDATFFTGVPLAVSVEIYDIAANSWSYGNPVVTKAAAPSGGLAGGKAMVQGGVDNVTYYNTVQVLSPVGLPLRRRNSDAYPDAAHQEVPGPWTPVANMPVDLYGAAGASDGTYFYAAGGYSFSSGQTLADRESVRSGQPTRGLRWQTCHRQRSWLPQSIIRRRTRSMCSGVKMPSAESTTALPGSMTSLPTHGPPAPACRMCIALQLAATFPANGKIYILSGYNTGQVTSAQPNTWQYDPVANTWTDLTGTAPFPHPAGGMAFGVINNKIYVAGGRDAANLIIDLNWEYDPVANAYTAKANEPAAFQNNVPGSGAAQGLLWVFGGGNPFAGANALNGDKSAFPQAILRGVKEPRQPATANSGRFYDPVTNTWTPSPNMNVGRSFTSGGAIGNSLIIAAGGYNGSTTVASAETENIGGGCPTPTPTPTVTPTATPTPSCTPGNFQVLIVYADSDGPPTDLASQILAEPGVATVDLFDALAGTPTLAQLQQYDIVVPFSNSPFLDSDTLGNNLADYVDGGGIVVQYRL